MSRRTSGCRGKGRGIVGGCHCCSETSKHTRGGGDGGSGSGSGSASSSGKGTERCGSGSGRHGAILAAERVVLGP